MSPRRPFSNAEVIMLGQLPASRTKTLLLSGIMTGYRISELLSWRVSDVHNGVNIRKKVTVAAQNMKNKTAPRTVPIFPELNTLLSAAIGSNAQPSDYIFRSREGKNQPIGSDTANRNVQTLCARLGIRDRIGTHSMRKTYARLLYRGRGYDIILLKERLGHRDVRTTQSYLEVADVKVDALMREMLCDENEYSDIDEE